MPSAGLRMTESEILAHISRLSTADMRLLLLDFITAALLPGADGEVAPEVCDYIWRRINNDRHLNLDCDRDQLSPAAANAVRQRMSQLPPAPTPTDPCRCDGWN